MEENLKARERERTATRQAEQPQHQEKDAPLKCPHCGAALDRPDYEICPVCGGKLASYCTFCGAPMSPSDIDCPECGMPADGVECPACHIRNFRPFCRQCGQPLSKAARRAVEKAKEDPKVLETARLLVKIAQLEAELETAGTPEDGTPEEPTEAEIRLKALMAKVGFTAADRPQPGRNPLGIPASHRRRQQGDGRDASAGGYDPSGAAQLLHGPQSGHDGSDGRALVGDQSDGNNGLGMQ